MRAKLDFWRGWKKHRGGEEKNYLSRAAQWTLLGLIQFERKTEKNDKTKLEL
jgi:hypothetical protein